MDELGSRMEMTEDQSRVLKDRSIEFTQSEQQTGRGKKKKTRIRNNNKRPMFEKLESWVRGNVELKNIQRILLG